MLVRADDEEVRYSEVDAARRTLWPGLNDLDGTWEELE
jgi:hypothetical protein